MESKVVQLAGIPANIPANTYSLYGSWVQYGQFVVISMVNLW